MPDKRKYLNAVITGISAVLQVVAFFSIFAIWKQTTIPIEWRTDFSIFAVISLTTTVVLPMIGNGVVLGFLFFLRVLVYMLVSLPLGALISIRFLLLASIFMDLGVYTPLKYSTIVIGLLSILAALAPALQKPVEEDVTLPFLFQNLTVLVSSLSVGALAVILKFLFDRLSEGRSNIEQLNSSVTQLTSANTEFLQYASTVEKESVANERSRITRELHDVVGQTLTNIIMMMDAALHRSDATTEDVRRMHQWTRDQAQSGLEETRAALYELRSIRIDRLKGINAIKKLIDTFSSLTNVKITTHWGNLPWEMEEDLDQTLYRIVRESLTNSFRHGRAKGVTIYFFITDNILNVTIADDGKGGGSLKKGIGQTGMEERVKKVGGEITFHSEPSGYTVTVRLPLSQGTLREAH